MKVISISIAACVIVLTLCWIGLPALSQAASNVSDEQILLGIERQMNDADAHHNADQMSKFLDDAYLIKSMEGDVFDKSATLASMRLDADAEKKTGKSLPAPLLEDVRTAVLGGSALAVFNFTIDLGNRSLHCRMTDTFLKRTDGWKLVGRNSVCR